MSRDLCYHTKRATIVDNIEQSILTEASKFMKTVYG